MINKFIIFLPYKKVNKYKRDRNLNISSKYFKDMKTNDLIYFAEIKNNNHIMSEKGYCFNCAYKTWDVGKSIKEYCAPLIFSQFQILQVKEVNKIVNLSINLINIFDEPKLIFNFQTQFVNKKVLRIQSIFS